LPTSITFREGEPNDASLLFLLFAENRTAELRPLNLPLCILQPLIEMQYRSRCAEYRQAFPSSRQEIVLDCEGHAVGHILLYEAADHIHIVDLAILLIYRGRGLGGAVLQLIFERARSDGRSVTLQVSPHSPARSLYQHLGFVTTGEAPLATEMEWTARTSVRVATA
jgi:ribosomal protein S18 acetylase RimI-like enzyme